MSMIIGGKTLMSRPTLPLVLIAALTGYTVFAQGLTTTATKDDWEEINFAFDSATLVDGYPSLLRLSELLGKNQTYKVRLSGHTDWHGSKKYNQKLGESRAKTVKSFLEKYGARPAQIELSSLGSEKPKATGKNVDAELINRRVEMTVLDGNGKPVSAGGVGSAIQSLENTKTMADQCCSEVLKRLDKLDDILSALRGLKTENESIKQQLASMGDG
ncbi:MAG: OmpA family protein, partial [Verrucomicrobiota bacterium]